MTAFTAADVYQEAMIQYESVGAEELGNVYQRMLQDHARDQREKGGSYYTPEPVADFVSRFALDLAMRQIEPEPDQIMRITALDPACGSGIFLVRAAHFLSVQYAGRLVGGSPTAGLAFGVLPAVVLNCVFGVDIDPVAVDLARLSISLETAGAITPAMLERHIICGDALAGDMPPALEDRSAASKAAA